eukprot:Trichotokara_eunicae@DN3129_c0_g1_i1.p1
MGRHPGGKKKKKAQGPIYGGRLNKIEKKTRVPKTGKWNSAPKIGLPTVDMKTGLSQFKKETQGDSMQVSSSKKKKLAAIEKRYQQKKKEFEEKEKAKLEKGEVYQVKKLEEDAQQKIQNQSGYEAKMSIATIAHEILSDPQNKIERLKALNVYLDNPETEPDVRTTAILAYGKVLSDLLPGYKVLPKKKKKKKKVLCVD